MAAEASATDPALADVRRSTGAIVGLTARRAVRGAVIWGAVFGLVAWLALNEFDTNYPTAAARERLGATFGANVGLQALFGPTIRMGTMGGYVQFHVGVLGLIGAVWGVLTSSRLLRGEEEAGRWELLVSGRTTRGRATAGALVGLYLGALTIWLITAGVTFVASANAGAGFSLADSLLTGLTAVAAAILFLAVGALCSQLSGTRRQAAALAAAVLGAAYLLRIVAYSAPSLDWLRWASPLAWVDEVRPLTGARPLAALLVLGVTALLCGSAVALAARRDLGAGLLPGSDEARTRTGLLGSPLGLTVRLDLRPSLGWIAGLAAGGLLLGLITKVTAEAWADQSGGVLRSLGGASGGAGYLGIVFLVVALLVSVWAAGQAAATREQEAEGYLDHLLARPVSRLPWLAGRWASSAFALLLAGALTGIASWAGAAIAGAGLRFGSLLGAGLNVVPAGLFVLGVGTLVHGVAPRWVALVGYGLVAWSFLVEILGAGLGVGEWVLQLSVLHHMARAPAESVSWGGLVALTVLGVASAMVGAWAFARRDLVTA